MKYSTVFPQKVFIANHSIFRKNQPIRIPGEHTGMILILPLMTKGCRKQEPDLKGLRFLQESKKGNCANRCRTRLRRSVVRYQIQKWILPSNFMAGI